MLVGLVICPRRIFAKDSGVIVINVGILVDVLRLDMPFIFTILDKGSNKYMEPDIG